MGLFDKKPKPNKGGLFADMIMSPEHDRNWLIYKWRPEGEEAGSTNRENSIRYTSSLTVRQGEVAVFQYGGKESGGKQDYIEGFFSDTVKTANLPILAGIVGAAFGGGTPFPAQVYFINLAAVNQVQFGVPYFSMFDPRLPDHPVDVAVRGTITFKLGDYKGFVGMYALADFDLDKFKGKIKTSVIDHVQSSMMDIQAKLGKPLIQINTYRREIKDILQSDLGSSMTNTFGVTVTELNLSAIEIDQESQGYQELSRVTRAATSAKLETELELSQRGMRDQFELNRQANAAMTTANMENYAATMAINREEGQHAMRQQTDMNAYAQKMQADVAGLEFHRLSQQENIGVAAANAMGKMGQGAGVDIGGGAGGFNPGAMMAGMAMGGAVGQGMAGMMGNVFSQMGNQMPGAAPSGAPPPMPPGAGMPPQMPGAAAVAFSVSVNGQAGGPYDVGALAQMAASGQLNAQSMVWRQGMAAWQGAGSVPELAHLFAAAPPPMPGPPPPMPGADGPPPMPGAAPAVAFSVSVNGQAGGPYDMGALAQMAASGQLSSQSMVWRQGMADWQSAGSVPELAQLFASAGPPSQPPASPPPMPAG